MVTIATSHQSLEVEEMIKSDEFSEYYADFLDGNYDCVDRIVLNALLSTGINTWRATGLVAAIVRF